MQPSAIVIGITGQDGGYLAEILLEKGYRVFGGVHKDLSDLGCSSHLGGQIELIETDLSNPVGLSRVCELIRPDEFYNLGTVSNVYESLKDPVYAAKVIAVGTLGCLEALKQGSPESHFVQATSSSIYQKTPAGHLITESTGFGPTNPYGTGKLFGYWSTINYRNNFNMFACNAILFSHTSPRYRNASIIHKIVMGAKDIYEGRARKMKIGNLDATRGWGHAKDFCEGMWRIATHTDPDDYILALSDPCPLGKICQIVFAFFGMENYEDYLEKDDAYFSPFEVNFSVGNAAKAKTILGWAPKYSTSDLIQEILVAME